MRQKVFQPLFAFILKPYELFWPGVNVRLLSTDSHAGMEAASGKTTNELEQHKKNVRKKWDYYQLPADVFYYGSDSGYPSGKLLL